MCCNLPRRANVAAEESLQLEVCVDPDSAGEAASAPQTAPAEAAAGAAATGAGGRLMVEQDRAQGAEGAGVVTGAFQLGERGPH